MLRVVFAVGLALGLAPAFLAAQPAGSYKVQRFQIRFHYVDGRTDVHVKDFDNQKEAERIAKQVIDNNNKPGVSNPGDYISKYEIVPVTVTITPPGRSAPGGTLQENSPKPSVPAPAPKPFVSGNLTASDPANGGRHYRVYDFTVVKGVRYTILLRSGTGQTQNGKALPGFFDPVLIVKGSQGGVIASNDDINWPANCNARVTFVATYTGTVQFQVTSFRAGETGPFSLETKIE